MKLFKRGSDCTLYTLGDGVFVATTPQTRAICNDPLIYGLSYTRKLRQACVSVLKALQPELVESETVVAHLLRGGLNFGLREALGEAFEWNAHGSTFLSAQRKRTSDDPECWEIRESEYRKFVIPPEVSFVLGDVVASGASLEYGLTTLADAVKERGASLRSILFFTIGGPRTEEVFHAVDNRLRREHQAYQGSTLIYLEGRFPLADCETSLKIKVTGTDLLRHGNDMAPEFIESQYENPMFPVERCTIYDAGSRAFEPDCYLRDVLEYWEEVATFHRLSFTDYLKERAPSLEPGRFQVTSLRQLAELQCEKLRSVL